MRVSQEKKQETRLKIVNAAAELFVEKGFDGVSMKTIAKAAGVGDATIYKYFPNKEKLILGFYDVRGAEAIKNYHLVDELEQYSFSEKLQLLIDTYLEQLICDREFVELSMKQVIKTPLTLFKDELAIAKAYKAVFSTLLEELDEDESYPEIPMQGALAGLLTDYLLGITLFWIKDDSEEYANTTQISDLSISLIDAVLKSGLINKAMEIAGFIIKTYLLRGMAHGGGILALLQEFKSGMSEHLQS
ncbi:MAG: TetR/AcrR family transcriptional regulator of autoinduction and epiphytic fitness [Flavobacteriales bacterium]|jgi:TetR/AcrR family transcriptional regulator of autoinduction and epiphytic fitness